MYFVSYRDKCSVHIFISSLIYGGVKIDKDNDSMKEIRQTSIRKCEIGGKKLTIVRHFSGNGSLSEIIYGIAVNRAKNVKSTTQ